MAVSPMEVYHVELLLFAALAAGIVFLRPRASLLCLLLAGCIEVVPPDFVTSSSVSWANVLGRLLLPAFVLLRLTKFRMPTVRWSFASAAWLSFTLYAAVAISWSPNKLSAVKMVAYLVGWFVLYLIFEIAWSRRLLDQGLVIAALWGSLALAFLQSYVLGNPLFSGSGLGDFSSAQFAPFTGPQSFGPFLACLLALLLFSRERQPFRSISILACLVALVLVGSRYSLIEAGMIVLTWCVLFPGGLRNIRKFRLAPVTAILLVGVLTVVGLRATMAWAAPKSRVNQLLDAGADPDVLLLGTFGWRLLIYQRVFTELSGRSLKTLIFGSGTSSGGEIPQELQGDDPEQDPNRNIHDEFLRAEYEWGFIGLGLGLCLLGLANYKLLADAYRTRSLGSFACLAVMPGVLLALLIENPLAGPGTAESLGYLLVLTYGFTRRDSLYSRLAPRITPTSALRARSGIPTHPREQYGHN